MLLYKRYNYPNLMNKIRFWLKTLKSNNKSNSLLKEKTISSLMIKIMREVNRKISNSTRENSNDSKNHLKMVIKEFKWIIEKEKDKKKYCPS